MRQDPHRILIVDHDPSAREVLRATLAAADREVHTAGTIDDAFARLRSRSFQLLIAGLEFPGRSGLELVEHTARDHGDMSIVVTTSSPSVDTAVRALRAGAVEYIEKPFTDLPHVAAMIGRVLSSGADARFKADLLEKLSERNRALDAERKVLFRKMNIVQRNLREQVKNLERSREIYYLDLTRVMTIIDNIVDGIVFTDLDGKVILINPAASRQLGLQSFEALGKSLGEISGNREILGVLCDAQTDSVDAGPQIGDVEFWDDEDERVFYATYTTAVRGFDDGLAGTLSIIQDVTLRRKTEELKNQFLSIVAHELRTPLTGIKAFSTILGQRVFGELNDKQGELVSSIIHQSDRLGHEIDKIINLGRLESEDFIPDKEHFEAADLFKTISSPFLLDVDDKNLEFKCEADSSPSGAPITLWADRRDIRRAIQSLLENAIKFTPEGGAIRLGARATESEDEVEIWVSDTGIGIDPRYHRVIFEKFMQIENPLTRRYGGSGLGLSFAGQIIKAHGSEIRIDSELGRGSTFTFRIRSKPEAETASNNEGATPSTVLAGSQGPLGDEGEK